jgi:hypothetical protein
MKSKFITWIVEIEVVTSDRGYNNNDGKGLVYMDVITDDILETLLNRSKRITLQGNAIYFVNPEVTPAIPEIINNELVYRRSILVEFSSKIQVSA